MTEIIRACQGMSQQQIMDRVSLVLRKHKNFTKDAVRTLFHEKGAVIRSSGLLQFIEPPKGGLDIVGGYEAVKEHVELDKPCFSDKAKEFGIDPPLGFLMVGISGCGKTLLATAVASEMGYPLIGFDVGNCMGSLVGESEKNVREAIKIIESVAPCVMLIDEIEKGFGGNGERDGGSSKRVFGTFLKWLNDRKSLVYAIATANEVQSLPPELFRKGRFDEIFGLDLPDEEERAKIFCIHLSKRDREPGLYNCRELAKITNGFTGADIEQTVKLALKMAFFDGTALHPKHIEKAIGSIIPLIKVEKERIENIRNWCGRHAKPASHRDIEVSKDTIGRKVNLN
jgi:SpoVK/Ycf46/Vps4 family AAA+-type ATPase